MLTLQRPFPSVQNNDLVSYGGCQTWSDREMIRKCGCGPVAVLDLLHYLTHEGDSLVPQPLAAYNEELRMLCRRYLPLIPYAGINGFVLTIGVNRLFLDRGLPYRAFWAFSGTKLWDRIREMLARDLPVILSVGPNFPAIWRKERLRFYCRRADGCFAPAASTKSHYFTVTGIDEDWLQTSSWGRRYFIKRTEYDEFVRKHSTYLFSNLLYIKTTDL